MNDVCLPVTIDVYQSSFTPDPNWIAGAFFLGLILGILFAALCVKLCLKDWEKKKRQDMEEAMIAGGTLDAVVTPGYDGTEKIIEGKHKVRKKSSRFSRKSARLRDEDESLADVQVDSALSRGMVDILVQTTSAGSNGEMVDQDMDFIISMEKDLQEEKETLMVTTLDNLLRKQVDKKNISEQFYQIFMKKTKEDVNDLRNIVDREKEEAEEKLRNDPKLSKDPEKLESELQKLQTLGNNKLAKLQREQREKIRQDLIRTSGMSEAEAQALIDKLMKNMAALEEKLGSEQARRRRNLEERLARRRQMVEYKKLLEDAENEEVKNRVVTLDQLLTQQVGEGKVTEKNKEEILHKFIIHIKHYKQKTKENYTKERESMLEKLRQRRLKRMQKLLDKQAKERAMHQQLATRGTSTGDFVKDYHDLLVRQHVELEEVSTELDQSEVQEMDKLMKDHQEQLKSGLNEEDKTFIPEIQSQTNLNEREVEHIMALHHKHIQALDVRKENEKQAMLNKLQDRLKQRLQAIEVREQQEAVEMETLVEQQTSVLNKVLESNMELTDDAKERVLQEHQRNMHALSNQLQNSKMRQQKSLEIKLNQRRARLEELRQKQEEIKLTKLVSSQKEQEKQEQQLAAQIAAEEEKLEHARQTALAEQRKLLALETEEALRLQDVEIGKLIGRLQVGQARRKAILQKQDKTLKELQDQLEKKMTEGVSLPKSYTDQLIQQHYNQVTNLSEQIQNNRERQERVLADKIQAKKFKREREIEHVIEEEVKEQYQSQAQRGAGVASQVLMQSLLEQRHRQAMVNLDKEMKMEMEKCREELNQQLELDLQKALEEEKQELLTKLAALSNLSKGELHEAVESAVTETGGDDKAAKKLAKDLQMGVKRAKTSISEDLEYNDEPLGLMRASTNVDGTISLQTGYDDDDKRPVKHGKKKKKKLLKVKKAFDDELVNEDDDF
ncbi:trichohyalin-like [Gigantopelta aegis]|uniref:trichohyalin-like n=1 Tax=Gigantopelta aegis TaxID=1735272 RepID=UPI001B88A323|nr:trichohyalin-like [Gigantopelta aegis]